MHSAPQRGRNEGSSERESLPSKRVYDTKVGEDCT